MTFTSSIRGGKMLVATALVFGALTTVCQAYSAEQEQLCTGDAMRLCGSEIPDVDRVTACMIRQRASLSDGCKAVFAPAPVAAPVAYRPTATKPSKPLNLTPRVK
jgi:hypothetical protein